MTKTTSRRTGVALFRVTAGALIVGLLLLIGKQYLIVDTSSPYGRVLIKNLKDIPPTTPPVRASL